MQTIFNKILVQLVKNLCFPNGMPQKDCSERTMLLDDDEYSRNFFNNGQIRAYKAAKQWQNQYRKEKKKIFQFFFLFAQQSCKIPLLYA